MKGALFSSSTEPSIPAIAMDDNEMDLHGDLCGIQPAGDTTSMVASTYKGVKVRRADPVRSRRNADRCLMLGVRSRLALLLACVRNNLGTSEPHLLLKCSRFAYPPHLFRPGAISQYVPTLGCRARQIAFLRCALCRSGGGEEGLLSVKTDGL